MNLDIFNIVYICSYFIIYSFMGWILESIYKTFYAKRFVNSGFLHGPFCPIYGIGALIMHMFLDVFKEKPIVLFVVSILILSILEYIVGLLLEKIFNTKYWDYSDSKFNIQGRVCLFNSVIWGFLGVIFTYLIHPIITKEINSIPNNILEYSVILVMLYVLVDAIVTIFNVKNMDVKLRKLNELSDSLKEKLDELKSLKENVELKSIKLQEIQKVIDELKYKQTKIKRKLLRQTNRLRKAFPTMKSDKITEFLTQKIEIIKKDK